MKTQIDLLNETEEILLGLLSQYQSGQYSYLMETITNIRNLKTFFNPIRSCKTCLHWKNPDHQDHYNATQACSPFDPDTYQPMQRGFEVKICKHPAQTFNESLVEDNGFGVVDGSGYSACLATSENFGCIRYESGT